MSKSIYSFCIVGGSLAGLFGFSRCLNYNQDWQIAPRTLWAKPGLVQAGLAVILFQMSLLYSIKIR